jgi:ubiquinone/menaquinone biosynthesis C-methylase UbiE
VRLGAQFSRLPRPISRRLYRVLRYTNLMRALEMRYLEPWTLAVQGQRVLDVGCGHGLYSLDLARRGAHLVGCDLSAGDLKAARETAAGLGLQRQTAYLQADGAGLPVPDNTFDLVVCNCVLEHIVDDQQALLGMHRSLVPGGLLYLTVDNAEHDLALCFLEHLPSKVKALLLWPEVATAPSVAQGLDNYLGKRYAVQRRYRRDSLEAKLQNLGFGVLNGRAYLSALGAAHYETFHVFRGLDPARGLGRLAHMVTSLATYPFAVLGDDPRRGYGLVLVARKMGQT